jgi:hydrogenase small subunit
MDVVKNQKGNYFAVVEGAIPLKDGGIYCTIGGKTAIAIANEVCGNALATGRGTAPLWRIAAALPTHRRLRP